MNNDYSKIVIYIYIFEFIRNPGLWPVFFFFFFFFFCYINTGWKYLLLIYLFRLLFKLIHIFLDDFDLGLHFLSQ